MVAAVALTVAVAVRWFASCYEDCRPAVPEQVWEGWKAAFETRVAYNECNHALPRAILSPARFALCSAAALSCALLSASAASTLAAASAFVSHFALGLALAFAEAFSAAFASAFASCCARNAAILFLAAPSFALCSAAACAAATSSCASSLAIFQVFSGVHRPLAPLAAALLTAALAARRFSRSRAQAGRACGWS